MACPAGPVTDADLRRAHCEAPCPAARILNRLNHLERPFSDPICKPLFTGSNSIVLIRILINIRMRFTDSTVQARRRWATAAAFGGRSSRSARAGLRTLRRSHRSLSGAAKGSRAPPLPYLLGAVLPEPSAPQGAHFEGSKQLLEFARTVRQPPRWTERPHWDVMHRPRAHLEPLPDEALIARRVDPVKLSSLALTQRAAACSEAGRVRCKGALPSSAPPSRSGSRSLLHRATGSVRRPMEYPPPRSKPK